MMLSRINPADTLATKTFPVHPEHMTTIICRNVVIPLDAVTVPPPGFNPFGTREHFQRPTIDRPLVAHHQAQRFVEHPDGTRLRWQCNVGQIEGGLSIG